MWKHQFNVYICKSHVNKELASVCIKKVAHYISCTYSFSQWDEVKISTTEIKREIIKELAKSTPLEIIAKKINRHLVTVKRFVHDPMKKRKTRSDRGILKSVTKRDLNHLKRNLRIVPGAISKRIFQESGQTVIPKTTRNRILGWIAKHKASKKASTLVKA